MLLWKYAGNICVFEFNRLTIAGMCYGRKLVLARECPLFAMTPRFLDDLTPTKIPPHSRRLLPLL